MAFVQKSVIGHRVAHQKTVTGLMDLSLAKLMYKYLLLIVVSVSEQVCLNKNINTPSFKSGSVPSKGKPHKNTL